MKSAIYLKTATILTTLLFMPTSFADSLNSLSALGKVLEGYQKRQRQVAGFSPQGQRVKTVHRQSDEPRVITDSGRVVSGPGKKQNCDTIRSGDTIGEAKAHKVYFGADDRELLSQANGVAAKIPSAVGIINCEITVTTKAGKTEKRMTNSSGTLVSLENTDGFATVITAGHVFFHPHTGEEHKNCYFLPEGKEHDKVEIPVRNRLYGFQSLSQKEDENDVAIVKVPENLKRKYGAMTMAVISEKDIDGVYKRGLVTELIGYSTKHQAIGISRKDCKLVRKQPGDIYYEMSGVYLHSCDTTSGSSGGVIVGTLGGRSVILGVHSGRMLDHNSIKNKGDSLSGDGPNKSKLGEGLPFDPKSYAGVAVNGNSPVLRALIDKVNKGIAF